MISARIFLSAIAVVWCSLNAVGSATAQTYPSHTITMVVPFSAGGPTDTLARIIAARMQVLLGQCVIIENVTGAAGTIGVGRVVRAAPDGYTISLGPMNSHVLTGAIYNLPFDLLRDLEPVALLANNPSVVVSRKDAPAKDLKELIAWVKANPEKPGGNVWGRSGDASWRHPVRDSTGSHIQFIPYRGTAPGDAGSGGRADRSHLRSIVEFVAADPVKAPSRSYAVTSKTRAEAAPDIPTMDEAGLPGLYLPVWNGMWVPKGTPKDIIDKLNRAVVESLADTTVRKRLAEIGLEVYPREQQTPEALRAYQKAEIEKWWPIVKAAGIKAE